MGSLEYPWFAFDVADWEGATAVMTDEQQGAYVRLLCFGWKEDGLPAAESAVRQIGRWGAPAWKRIWPALEAKWPIAADGRRRNPRQEAERAAAKKRRSDAQAKAIKRHAAASAVAGAATDTAAAQGQVPQLCEVQGSVPQPVQEPLPRELVTLSPPRAGAFDLSTGQVAASVSGLVGAWRNVAAGTVLFADVHATAQTPAVWRALHAHPDIDWWADVFAKVVASDFLCGREVGRDGRPFVATFWWVLDNADKVAAGQYDNRAKTTGNRAAAEAAKRILA